MILIHGDNHVASRAELLSQIEKLSGSHSIVRIDAKQLTRAMLEETLGAQSLFGSTSAVVIEGLHSLPHSHKRTEFIRLLTDSGFEPLIVWEQKKLTKKQISTLTPTSEKVFPVSKALFTWLSQLGVPAPKEKQRNMLFTALEQEDEYLCFIMIARQIRILLNAKTGGPVQGFRSKIMSQAKYWSVPQLIALHTRLLEHDVAYKSGQSKINWKVILDLATIEQ